MKLSWKFLIKHWNKIFISACDAKSRGRKWSASRRGGSRNEASTSREVTTRADRQRRFRNSPIKNSLKQFYTLALLLVFEFYNLLKKLLWPKGPLGYHVPPKPPIRHDIERTSSFQLCRCLLQQWNHSTSPWRKLLKGIQNFNVDSGRVRQSIDLGEAHNKVASSSGSSSLS